MKHRDRTSRKGVSILEVTIVLVVFTIIIVASTTLISNSVGIGRKNQRDMEIAIHSGNIIDCYRYYSGDFTDDAFVTLLQKTDENFVRDTENENIIHLDKPDYSITVKFDGIDKIEIEAQSDEKTIYSVSYQK